jgi:X-X-X-Leu-X-X-Gly heptad repeat protein
MYSAILNDGRLRDLVNGHAPPPNHFFHSDAAWTGSSTLDGQLATGVQQLRNGVAALGGGSNGGISNRAVDFDFTTASNAAAAAKDEEESVDIRQILSTPLPPIPSDVEFIRSQTFASTGALLFTVSFENYITLSKHLLKITLFKPLVQPRLAHL